MMRREFAGLLGTLVAGPTGGPDEPQPASVSAELAERGLPHAIRINVKEWNDADRVRVIQPSSVPAIQFIDRDNPLATLHLDNLNVTAGVMVESVHGEWRTTVATRWIVGDPVRITDEEPGLQQSAEWALDEMNETEADDAE